MALVRGVCWKTLKLELSLKANAEEADCKDIPRGYRKTVVVDRATGRVESVEREVSAEVASKGREIFYAAMEYGPQRMGDETLWLPKQMSAHNAAGDGRMTVTYTNYHRYTGTVTLKAVEPEGDSAKSPQ